MKIFIYKIIIVLIGFFLLFEFTIGSQIKDFKRELVKNISNEIKSDYNIVNHLNLNIIVFDFKNDKIKNKH